MKYKSTRLQITSALSALTFRIAPPFANMAVSKKIATRLARSFFKNQDEKKATTNGPFRKNHSDGPVSSDTPVSSNTAVEQSPPSFAFLCHHDVEQSPHIAFKRSLSFELDQLYHPATGPTFTRSDLDQIEELGRL
jgi:hypothetical protein